MLLTKATWTTLNTVTGADSYSVHLRDQRVQVVRPEVVIVSTLQQLLRAEGAQQKERAFFALETMGRVIHHAASKGCPRTWFDQGHWMCSVVLSKGLTADTQAPSLYEAERLDTLLQLLPDHPSSPRNQEPKLSETSILFFRILLQVSQFPCHGSTMCGAHLIQSTTRAGH